MNLPALQLKQWNCELCNWYCLPEIIKILKLDEKNNWNKTVREKKIIKNDKNKIIWMTWY